MPDFTNATFWINTLLAVLLPFIVRLIKWAWKDEPEGKLSFALTLLVAGGISVASFYLARFFKAPPSGFMEDFSQIFLLSQVVYQLLKEKLNL